MVVGTNGYLWPFKPIGTNGPRNYYIKSKSVHEGIKFSFSQCEYQTAQKGNLKIHKKSVHEGIEYSCNQCEYQATQKGDLKIHKKSLHEGEKYIFDKCIYQTGWKQELNKHKSRKHHHWLVDYVQSVTENTLDNDIVNFHQGWVDLWWPFFGLGTVCFAWNAF